MFIVYGYNRGKTKLAEDSFEVYRLVPIDVHTCTRYFVIRDFLYVRGR